MGCTDTVSTVGLVPGRRVAPGEETQNRVARWEACRRTKRNTHAFKSTARSNTRSHSRLQIQGVLLGEGTAWHLLSLHIQEPFSSLLINQAAWIAIQIPYALLLLLFLASTNVFFPSLFWPSPDQPPGFVSTWQMLSSGDKTHHVHNWKKSIISDGRGSYHRRLGKRLQGEAFVIFTEKTEKKFSVLKCFAHRSSLTRCPIHRPTQISLLSLEERRDGCNYLQGTGCKIQLNIQTRNSCCLQLQQARTMNSC